MTPTGNKAPGE